MPFTLAHPAAVLPLRRFAPGALVALLVGSMVPDTPYFLPSRLGGWGWLTHSLRGSLLVDVPLGCAAVLFLCLLRRPLTVLLGTRTRELVRDSLDALAGTPRHWLLAPPAVLLGAWTHIGWDSFTHSTGWMVRRVPLLRAPVTAGPYTTELCHVLQYLSSILGLWLLFLAWRRAVQSRPHPGSAGEHAAGPVLAAVLAAALIAGTLQVQQGWHGGSAYHLLMLLTTRSIAWFALLYVIGGISVLAGRRGVPACDS